MATKYIIDNLAEQTISGSLSAITLSADTLYVSGNSVSKPYKVYTALLTQTGTNAPIATVLENTIGNIVWTRTGVGDYRATLSGAFTLNKTAIFIGKNFTLDTSAVNPYDVIADTYGSINIVYLNSIKSGLIDGVLTNLPIEIRVYN